jgi:arylformamidase
VSSDNLDQQYNPRLSSADVPAKFEAWKSQAFFARSRLKSSRLNFEYGNSPLQTMDVFLASATPRISKGLPTLFFVHGGYWRAMDKRDFSFVAEPYVEAGINVVLTNYDLCPHVSLRTICLQQAAAVWTTQKNAATLHLHPDNFFISGHSAGGHLAAMLHNCHWQKISKTLKPNFIRGAVSLSGLFDLRPVSQAPFLKNDLRLSERQAIEISPALMASNNQAPLLLAVGALETQAFHDQSRGLQLAWHINNPQLMNVPNVDHFGICDSFCDPNSDLFKATYDLIKASKA